MKKTITCLFAGTIILCLIGSASGQPDNCCENPAAPSDLKILDVEAWDTAVYKMIPPPTENGNAVEYLLEATLGKLSTVDENSDTPSLEKTYPWWKNIKNDMYSSEDPKDVEIIAKAIEIPQLETLIKASNQNGYQFYGIYAMPHVDPARSFMEIPIMSYMDIYRLANILTFRAEHKLEAKDIKGAEADMFAAMRVGHIMQKDVMLIGFVLGCSIETSVAQKMPAFYKKTGDNSKSKTWTEFLETVEKHKTSGRKAFKNRSIEEVMTMVDNKTLPRSIQAEGLVVILGKHFEKSRITVLRKIPEEIKVFIAKDRFDDPEMIIVQMKVIEDIYAGQLSTLKKRFAIPH